MASQSFDHVYSTINAHVTVHPAMIFMALGVARRYFLRPKSSLEAALQETQASCRRQQEELAKKKELVVADLKAAESEIKELVQNHPEVAQRFLES